MVGFTDSNCLSVHLKVGRILLLWAIWDCAVDWLAMTDSRNIKLSFCDLCYISETTVTQKSLRTLTILTCL